MDISSEFLGKILIQNCFDGGDNKQILDEDLSYWMTKSAMLWKTISSWLFSSRICNMPSQQSIQGC